MQASLHRPAEPGPMGKNFDYSSYARQLVNRSPVFSYVMTQVNFWILANIFMAVVVHLLLRSFQEAFSLPARGLLASKLIVAVMLGALYGSALGLTDYFLEKRFYRNRPLGLIIVLRAAISLLVLIPLFALMRFVLFDLIIVRWLFSQPPVVSDEAWRYLFALFLFFYFFMTVIISFINQVNKKYGPGVLLPVLLGRYRTPKEEERIFMFMDLKSSTTIAEELGHIKFAEFIRDSFMDINHVVGPFNAEIYQYVGDEIIISWRVREGLKDLRCVQFFFACEQRFRERNAHYMRQYGFSPHFKAGLHMGPVTAVEIGDIKRDIAYFGDTMNTAARIQSVCNDYDKKLLVSAYLLETGGLDRVYQTENLGRIVLKGKTNPVGIFSINA
jgi:adenylate cyclase